MRDEVRPSKQAGIEPLDFIGVSRRVLHLASRGPGRIEFLREASRLLLDFSSCDALVLIAGIEDGASQYRWSATRVPRESSRLEPRFEIRNAKASSAKRDAAAPAFRGTSTAAWFDDLIASVFHREAGPASRCVTSHGSYWTGDVASDLALADAAVLLPTAATLEIRSIAVIPFDVGPSIPGVLALLGAHKGMFAAQSLEYYEALAQTLGLAMDDRRSHLALRERVKELTCLYAIAQVLESAEGPVSQTLADIARLLPPAWQFPEALVARIRIDETESVTGDIGRAVYRQEAPVIVDDALRGLVEVGYAEDRPEFVEGVFLPEEAHLIAAIAREVSLFVQRCDVRTEKLRRTEQARQTDRLATIGQLAAAVVHEINEPLGGILGFAQLAKKLPEAPERVVKDLDQIIRAALHAREVVRKLMLFARQSPPARSWVRINDIVDESLGLLTSRLAECGVKVVRDLDPACPAIHADAVQLNQVVVNLCVNGIQAMPRGGTLTLRTRPSEDSVSITVEDTGTGIPPETRERIFEPFFTTKSPEHGTGLGLSVVHGIVTAHGGSIDFDTGAGTGTRFEVRFPASPPSHGRKEPATDE